MKGSQVMAAVRKLRLGLDDTQQNFATRLGMAIATVVRYEHNRPPSGRALAKLERVALEHGFQEYAAIFRAARGDELGASLPVVGYLSLDCRNDSEKELVAAFLSIIRESPDSKDANLIKKILKPQVEEARRSREADEAFAEARRAVVRLLRAGHTLEGVVKSFTPRHIADALFEFGDPALIEQYRGELVELLVRDGLSIKQIAQRWFDSRVDEVYNLADNRGLRAACADHRRHLPGSD